LKPTEQGHCLKTIPFEMGFTFFLLPAEKPTKESDGIFSAKLSGYYNPRKVVFESNSIKLKTKVPRYYRIKTGADSF
jgi:hypothetical protein